MEKITVLLEKSKESRIGRVNRVIKQIYKLQAREMKCRDTYILLARDLEPGLPCDISVSLKDQQQSRQGLIEFLSNQCMAPLRKFVAEDQAVLLVQEKQMRSLDHRLDVYAKKNRGSPEVDAECVRLRRQMAAVLAANERKADRMLTTTSVSLLRALASAGTGVAGVAESAAAKLVDEAVNRAHEPDGEGAGGSPGNVQSDPSSDAADWTTWSADGDAKAAAGVDSSTGSGSAGASPSPSLQSRRGLKKLKLRVGSGGLSATGTTAAGVAATAAPGHEDGSSVVNGGACDASSASPLSPLQRPGSGLLSKLKRVGSRVGMLENTEKYFDKSRLFVVVQPIAPDLAPDEKWRFGRCMACKGAGYFSASSISIVEDHSRPPSLSRQCSHDKDTAASAHSTTVDAVKSVASPRPSSATGLRAQSSSPSSSDPTKETGPIAVAAAAVSVATDATEKEPGKSEDVSTSSTRSSSKPSSSSSFARSKGKRASKRVSVSSLPTLLSGPLWKAKRSRLGGKARWELRDCDVTSGGRLILNRDGLIQQYKIIGSQIHLLSAQFLVDKQMTTPIAESDLGSATADRVVAATGGDELALSTVCWQIVCLDGKKRRQTLVLRAVDVGQKEQWIAALVRCGAVIGPVDGVGASNTSVNMLQAAASGQTGAQIPLSAVSSSKFGSIKAKMGTLRRGNSSSNNSKRAASQSSDQDAVLLSEPGVGSLPAVKKLTDVRDDRTEIGSFDPSSMFSAVEASDSDEGSDGQDGGASARRAADSAAHYGRMERLQEMLQKQKQEADSVDSPAPSREVSQAFSEPRVEYFNPEDSEFDSDGSYEDFEEIEVTDDEAGSELEEVDSISISDET